MLKWRSPMKHQKSVFGFCIFHWLNGIGPRPIENALTVLKNPEPEADLEITFDDRFAASVVRD